MKSILQAFRQAVADGVFPGAVVLVRYRGDVVVHEAVGTRGESPDDQPAHRALVYDLASLTKPLATATALLCLARDGYVRVSQPVSHWVTELRGGAFADVTLWQLLSHSAGLPAVRPYYERVSPTGAPPRDADDRQRRVDVLLRAIAEQQAIGRPGSHSVYSDAGFLLLGVVVERCAGTSLAAYCRQHIYAPLEVTSLGFLGAAAPDETWAAGMDVAPTEWDDRRRRLLCGDVHDENADALGGVAGHAGLFGTAHAVSQLSAAWLAAVNGRAGVLDVALARQFTSRRLDVPGSSWALGWDTPSTPSTSGTRLSARAFGHTGFTGTSVWIDPACELEVIILSNRVHPSRTNQAINTFRPHIHDVIYQACVGE